MKKYVVFDIETTGLSYLKGDKIIEIGAIKIIDGKIVEEFSSFINPQINIPYYATRVNGITDEMVKQAPLYDDVLIRFKAFAEDSILVAHNARFDLGFVTHFLSLIDLKLSNEHIDTLSYFKKVYPGKDSYKLERLAEHFNINYEKHRALSDAKTTAKLFLMAKEKEKAG